MQIIKGQDSNLKINLAVFSEKPQANSINFASYLTTAKKSSSTSSLNILHTASVNRQGELEVNKLELKAEKSQNSQKNQAQKLGISLDDLIHMPNVVSKSIKDGEVVCRKYDSRF